MPDKLKKQYQNLINTESDLNFCKIRVDINGNILELPDQNLIDKFNDNNYQELLFNGNFISTQAILVKKDALLKINGFDENLPRFQDYDLVLRLSSNIKFSFTNEVLVNLYRQKDSISSNTNCLLDTIKVINNKKYAFGDDNKNIIVSNLIDFYSNELITKYNCIILEKDNNVLNLNNEINNLRKEINDLKDKNNQLESIIKDNNELNNKLANENNELSKIVNSKRVKVVNKVCKIVGK